MQTRTILIFAALLSLVGCRNRDGAAVTRPTPKESLLFAFYNLENAWDPSNEPAAGDDDFTPEGPMRWTQERLDRKLESVARALRAMDDDVEGDGIAGEGVGPDVVGLCEIENRSVVQQLVANHMPAGVYAVVHAESPDERGIDVALIYRASALTLKGFRMHRVDLGPGRRPTRDIMEATFERGGRRLTVLVNHWPSKRGGANETEGLRLRAAETAARVVDSLTALDPRADIVFMGDLNDVPSSAPVSDALDAREYDGAAGFSHRMINTAAPVERVDTIGSYYYRGGWETIDQIMLATAGALDSAGLMLYRESERVFAPEFLRDAKADPVNRPPYHTYIRGSLYIGGTSDHFPVMLRVGWNGVAR